MTSSRKWVGTAVFGAAFVLGTLILALVTERWVLTALPVGFLFGFFLQKGDLCSASAFSEVILAREGRKVFGLWVCIVVSMLGFALGDQLGWIKLAPKQMLWVNYLVGGLVFGAGTVFAGGCISGCLFKAATGNLNSLVALFAMPAGMAAVEYGPLSGWFAWMKTHRVQGPDGAALSLPSLTGLPFWVLALLFAAGTLIAALAWRRRGGSKRPGRPAGGGGGPWHQRVLLRPWRPWQAGLAIGCLALFAFISSAASGRGYAIGVTHGVLQSYLLLTEQELEHVHARTASKGVAAPPQAGAAARGGGAQPASGLPDASRAKSAAAAPAVAAAPGSALSSGAAPAPATGAAAAPAKKKKKVVWWLVLVVLSTMIGAHVAGRLSGNARLLPKPPDEMLFAILGGLLVGAGAAIATGCVIGNILSGWALMSVGLVIFGVATILANWVVTYFYLLGGGLFSRN